MILLRQGAAQHDAAARHNGARHFVASCRDGIRQEEVGPKLNPKPKPKLKPKPKPKPMYCVLSLAWLGELIHPLPQPKPKPKP